VPLTRETLAIGRNQERWRWTGRVRGRDRAAICFRIRRADGLAALATGALIGLALGLV